MVIYLEENKNIGDVLRLRIIFPDGAEVNYEVPVIKNWEYDSKKLIENKFYVLLPLQVLKFRKMLESIRNSSTGNKKEQLRQLIVDAKNTAFEVSTEARKLLDISIIYDSDFEKLLLAVENLMEYLNRKYVDDDKIRIEVRNMIKTLYDPIVEKKGIEKGEARKALEIAKNLLEMGMDIETVSKASKIGVDQIKELKRAMKN